MKLKNFKKGDKVVMFNCMEANHPQNHGKLWECETDSFKNEDYQPELVFLKGYSGSFWCKYLQLVKVE